MDTAGERRAEQTWRERKELTESVRINTTMIIERSDVAILRIKAQQGHEMQMSEAIQEAGESWRRKLRERNNSQEMDHEGVESEEDVESNTGLAS
jgi:predicted GTPase